MLIKVIEKIKNNFYFTILLTGILFFLSFPSYDLFILKGFPFFAWISLVPVFIYIKGKNYKDIYIFAFIAGLAGNFAAFSWVGNFAAVFTGGYTLIVSFLIPAISIVFAARIILAEVLSKRFENLRFLIFPSVWIFIDWITTIGFIAFPWTFWGNSQYPLDSFIQVSSIIGVLGINFLIIIFNYLISDIISLYYEKEFSFKELFKSIQGIRLTVLFSIILMITVIGKIVLVKNDKKINKDLRVSIIQTCISPWDNWDQKKYRNLAELIRISINSLPANPDILIWSESATLEHISYHYFNDMPSDFDEILFDFCKSKKISVLTGEIGVKEVYGNRITKRYPKNNAVLIDPEGKVVKTYPKIQLVPFGEWFPYEKWLPFIKKLLESYGGSNFVPGKDQEIFTIKGRKFGTLVCYEGIFPEFCRKYRNSGIDFFVNITNDGWSDAYSGHMQHFSAAKFRAIENGIWYVRAGNTGFTTTIDPYGRIRSSIPILTKDHLTGDLDFSLNHTTFYSKFGDILLYIVMIFLSVIGILGFRKGKNKEL
jgi:apolipoprotein N-acyltransferase